jgi:cystathionine beta-lyase family protein involved in aluminum resistance
VNNFSPALLAMAERCEREVRPIFDKIDAVCRANTAKVMGAFAENRISETDFISTTGYGYSDRGRDKLDALCADLFGAEDALVRPQFVSGTHAIAAGLYGVLRPGDTLLAATDTPYDTILPVITGNIGGTLKEYGVSFQKTTLLEPDGTYDEARHHERLECDLKKYKPKVVHIQRSRGYSLRPSLSVSQIGAIAEIVKRVLPDAIVFVDNCYGEFVEEKEPCEVGADILCGSLIKNPGGGLAPTGGYVAGRADLVELASCRLTVPGLGRDAGSYAAGYRLFYQGFFMAPHVVAQALKTAVFTASLLESAGFFVSPGPNDFRTDIIQAISLGSREKLLAFLKGIQAGAPIDSFVTPTPTAMPGYDDEVAMAAGAFVQGASIELSADGPMRPPFTAFLQGGLTFESGRLGILRAVTELGVF